MHEHHEHHQGHHGSDEPMSVEQAKLRLITWGVATDEAFTAKLDEVRDTAKHRVRSAVPWLAGVTALAGVLAGVRGYRKRREPRGRYGRSRRERERDHEREEKHRHGGLLGAIIAGVGLVKAAAPLLRVAMVYYQRRAAAAAAQHGAQDDPS